MIFNVIFTSMIITNVHHMRTLKGFQRIVPDHVFSTLGLSKSVYNQTHMIATLHHADPPHTNTPHVHDFLAYVFQHFAARLNCFRIVLFLFCETICDKCVVAVMPVTTSYVRSSWITFISPRKLFFASKMVKWAKSLLRSFIDTAFSMFNSAYRFSF